MKVNFSSQFQSIVDKWGDLEAIVNTQLDLVAAVRAIVASRPSCRP